MSEYDELVEIWRYRALHRFSKEAVEPLRLPDQTKEFLIQVGMPLSQRNYFRLTTLRVDLPLISDITNDVVAGGQRFRVFGENGHGSLVHGYYCLEEPIGAVHAVQSTRLRPQLEPYFANSSILQLVQFVMILQDYVEWIIRWEKTVPWNTDLYGNEEVMEQTKTTVERLQECDERAVSEANQFLADDRPVEELRVSNFVWTDTIVRLARTGFWE